MVLDTGQTFTSPICACSLKNGAALSSKQGDLSIQDISLQEAQSFFLSESFFSVVLERSTGTSGRVLSLLPFEATLDDYIGTLLKNKNAN